MSNLTFYRHPVSGHSHRVELMLSLLDLKAEVINVDLMTGAQKKKLNIYQKIPLAKCQR